MVKWGSFTTVILPIRNIPAAAHQGEYKLDFYMNNMIFSVLTYTIIQYSPRFICKYFNNKIRAAVKCRLSLALDRGVIIIRPIQRILIVFWFHAVVPVPFREIVMWSITLTCEQQQRNWVRCIYGTMLVHCLHHGSLIDPDNNGSLAARSVVNALLATCETVPSSKLCATGMASRLLETFIILRHAFCW